MPQESAEFLELIGNLHQGVVDESMWTSALDGLCDLLGTSRLLFASINTTRGDFDHLLSHRMNPEVFALIAGRLANPRDNPWLTALPREPLRRPVTFDRLGGRRLFEDTGLWNEVYSPFRLGDSAGAVLERQRESTDVALIWRFRREPDFAPADLEAFCALLPHLARAWRVKRTLVEWEAKVGTLKSILDRLERAVIVTGPDGRVRFANRAADHLLSRGDSLDARQGRLRAARPLQDRALVTLIERAACTGAGAGTAAVDAMPIGGQHGGPPLAVVAEPLAPLHAERLGHPAEPGAIIFVGDSEAYTCPSPERLGRIYGLTPAETRVTSLVVQGHGLSAVARALGIGQNTVKYHLKAIFGKVGVSRQPQLVRRVLADVGGLAEPTRSSRE
ncbi:MAG TPA: LuxR C-terminal-related transcriptional regulator [Allosphingosinicella sp.]|nr:LuxR C-terminal-related transcriptional regulator [Allosphingosinicella sp.]